MEERMNYGFLQYYLVDINSFATVDELLVEEAIENPTAAYNKLKQQGDVVWNEETASWYVLNADDVRALLKDDRLRARGVPASIYGLPESDHAIVQPVEEFFGRWLAFSDPPKQSAIRRALAPNLTPQALANHFASLPEYARELVNKIPDDEADLLKHVVLPLSQITTQAILGVAVDEIALIEEHSNALIDYLATPGTDVPKARVAQKAIEELTIVVEKLLTRDNGIATSLVNLQARHGDVDELDVVATYAQLLTGAMEPLTTALATCLVEVKERADLMTNKIALSTFIDDCLRDNPPFHFAPRVARQDFNIAGVQIKEGDRVVLNLLAANLDSCPIDHGNSPTKLSHLSFGSGTHFCLGAAVSRTHLETVLPVLVGAKVPGRINHAAIAKRRTFGATGFDRISLLPLS